MHAIPDAHRNLFFLIYIHFLKQDEEAFCVYFTNL